jgi:hypothetical protein
MRNESRANSLGKVAVVIVKELWPEFSDVSEYKNATYLDKAGIDGWLNHVPVQIKADRNIAIKGNFYKEHYKKTYENRTVHQGDPWRITPFYAVNLVFITSYKAYIVSVDAFARAAIGRPVTQVLPTSIGVLVPISEVDIQEERDHDHSLDEYALKEKNGDKSDMIFEVKKEE